MKKTKVIPLTVGAWNVRTLMDTSGSKRPERRTALVGRELARYNVDIAALSETRLGDIGQVTEVGAGYTFFWSGRGQEERRDAGVGFAVKNHLVNQLASQPKGINDRLMTLQLHLFGKKAATIISAYAPTMTNSDEIKIKFYNDLEVIIAATASSDKLLILGDFNARVGSDHQSWNGVIGAHGIGKCNSNGLLLLQTCSEFDLLITNTIFQLPKRKKTSWMHPRSHHWHLIDYVIVRRSDRHDVRVTKAMCGAECWTDHRLIISKLNIRIKPSRRPQGQRCVKRLNITRLQQEHTRLAFVEALDHHLESLSFEHTDVEADWTALKTVLHSTALESLGVPLRTHQDWFDENDAEIRVLLDEKHRLHKAYLNDSSSSLKKVAFLNIRRIVQQRLRVMQDAWLCAKAVEIQSYADSNNTKCLYNALKQVYGPQHSGTSALLNLDGTTLLTEKDKILERWVKHYSAVLNRPSCINEEAIARLPQVEINQSLAVLPSIEEISKAITLLSSGKAPGSDAIPAEIYKAGGPRLVEKLTDVFQAMWKLEAVPKEFKDTIIINLYKRKGKRQDCDNHRGISILSVAGKILARILLNRLIVHLDQGLLPESQCGFRKDRGTTDMVFTARQLQEKCQEQNVDLYMAFVDLTKAFDTVSREGLWKIMAKYGCPDKFIGIVRNLHDGMTASVRDQQELSDPFPITNGVKQGCVLAPTLFSMVFSAMLQDSFQNYNTGINFIYRFDGGLFNLRRMQAKTRVEEVTVRELLFADDCALVAGSNKDLQDSMDHLSSACNNFGLTISTKKTEVLYQPAPGKPYTEPTIFVNGQKLSAVDRFTYLGSTLSRAVHIDDEVNIRIVKASAAFGRLRDSVWERTGIKQETKLKVYRAVVLPTLLYGCEAWTVYQRHAKKLNHIHLSCLRKLLRIKWQDKIPDTEVLSKANIPSIYTMLAKEQLRWTGHVTRMPYVRLPKQVFFGELKNGKRAQGGPKKGYKDTLKASLKSFGLDLKSWESLAQDRPAWRRKVQDGAVLCESRRSSCAILKRQQRKSTKEGHVAVPQSSTSSLTCPVCHREFRARIGLFSHLRTHQNPIK